MAPTFGHTQKQALPKMSIKFFRIFSLIILAWMLFTKSYILLLYWLVFVGLLEFLNLQKSYKSKNFKKLNALFFLYLLFITVIRTVPYKIDLIYRYIINSIEHLLFSLVVCLIIYFVIEIFQRYKERTFTLRVIATTAIFYFIGVANEVYQNIAKGKPALVFDKGALIDLVVNLVGAAAFIIISYTINVKKVKKTVALKEPSGVL